MCNDCVDEVTVVVLANRDEPITEPVCERIFHVVTAE
jgi:hypothetical protein